MATGLAWLELLWKMSYFTRLAIHCTWLRFLGTGTYDWACLMHGIWLGLKVYYWAW
jgi:hypothetical protein